MTTSCDVAGLEVAGNGKNGVVLLRSSCHLLVVSQFSRKAELITYIAALAVVIRSCRRCRFCVCISAFIVDGSQSVGLIGKIAIGAEIGAHPISGRRGSNALHNDIAALTDAEGHDVGGVRLDGHKVVGNDCHIVAIDGEALNAFSTAVDKP